MNTTSISTFKDQKKRVRSLCVSSIPEVHRDDLQEIESFPVSLKKECEAAVWRSWFMASRHPWLCKYVNHASSVLGGAR